MFEDFIVHSTLDNKETFDTYLHWQNYSKTSNIDLQFQPWRLLFTVTLSFSLNYFHEMAFNNKMKGPRVGFETWILFEIQQFECVDSESSHRFYILSAV